MKRIFTLGLSLALAASLCLTPASALTAQQAGALLEEYYVDQVPDSVLSQTDLDTMLNALGDPYTFYMTREEYQSFLESINGGSVVGIGVSVQSEVTDQGFLILSILPNSPAQQAGLEEGDCIQSIDGVPVTDASQAADLTGEEGTQVTITVLSAGTGETRELTLTRQAVAIPIVIYSLVDGAPVIECLSFGDTTAPTISQALKEYDALDRPVILDLRSNPGGSTSAAADGLGSLVGEHITAYFRDGDGTYAQLSPESGYPDLTDQPVIILTDRDSASASELFSAAVRDYQAGIAVGDRTYGKGVAQIVLDEESAPDLFDGDALKITAYRFFSPGGATNDTVGVIPTLLMSQEYAPLAALLLTASQPGDSQGYWKLDLAGCTFYVSRQQAAQEGYRDAFAQMLEALPPSARLSQGAGGSQWTGISPGQAAQSLGVTYHCRWDYSDLGQSAYPDDVATLSVYNLLSGYPDGTFRPQQTITRGEFAVLLASALHLTSAASAGFADVPDGSWFADGINAMAAKGFLAGRSSSVFAPQDQVSYEEMTTILSAISSWACMEGYSVSKESIPAGRQPLYSGLSSWAQAPAWRLSALGVELDLSAPQAPATRDQAAHLICQFLQAAGLLWNR